MQSQDYGAPVGPAFGGGTAGSVMHPVVIGAMILAIILILVLPRKYAIAPFLYIVFLASFGQQLNIGGLHFFVPRIVVMFGFLRMAIAKWTSQTEIASGGMNAIDKAFCGWAGYRVLAVTLLFLSLPAVINQGGFLLDVLGVYFILRFLIRDQEDVIRAAKVLAAISLVVGICMLNEKLRSQNIFGYLGSVPIVPANREGAVRAQGPFGHPILAGCFAATVLPLFILLWKNGKSKVLSVAGMLGSTMAVFSSSSSTPLLAYLAVILGVCMWPLRKQMRAIRWGISILLVSLHLVMKAPVWFLINHVDIVAGNSGYHRAYLIDTFVRHFRDWWLIGTNAMGSWGYDMWDLSNEFIAQGEIGGLATLIFFIAMISIGFSWTGKTRKIVEGDRKQEWILWLLGVTLFSHVVAFFGISYWDQTQVSWFALFAMISAVCVPLLKTQLATSEQKQFDLVSSYSPAPQLDSTRTRLPN